MTFFVPQFEFARRRYRLGGDFGPSMQPQGPFGQPPNPALGSVLADWNPGLARTRDSVWGAYFQNLGNGVTFEQQRGHVCGVFDGSSYLLATDFPFNALSDLTGGCSVYVVCERTDANATQVGLYGFDDSSNSPSSDSEQGYGAWEANDTVSVATYNSSGTASSDATGTTLTRNQLEFPSFHFTTSALEARDAGVSAGSTATTNDPSGMDRFVIGGLVLSAPTSFFTGRIWRVLVCEGGYDAAVLAYLQDYYQDTPRLPVDLLSSDVVSLYDPEWRRYYDWGSDQDLTASGSVEFSERNGSLAMETRTSASFLAGSSVPFEDYDDESPLTVYYVAEYEDLAKTLAFIWQLSGANITDGAMHAMLRKAGSTGVGAGMYSDAGALGQDYHGGAATEGVVYFGVCVFGTSTLEAMVSTGGTLVGNGTTAKAASPTVFTKFTIGGTDTATGQALADGAKVHWCAAVRGSRTLAQHQSVADWASDNFPVGETVETAGWTGTGAANTLAWWSATDPLQDQHVGARTFTASSSPAPTLSSLRGRQAFVTASLANYLASSSPLDGMAAGETVTCYVLCEDPTGAGAVAWLNQTVNLADATEYTRCANSNNFIDSYANGSSQARDFASGLTVDTVYVLGYTFRRNANGTDWEVEYHIDGTLSGSPGSVTGGTPPANQDGWIIGGASPPFTNSTTATNHRIWDVIWQSGEVDSGVVTDLKALLS